MSKKDISLSHEQVVKAFYDALMKKDLQSLDSLCTEDATLMWALYKFEGRNEIKKWAAELGEHFCKLILDHTFMDGGKDYIVHKFNLKVTMPNGRRGWIPGVGKYEFKDRKLKQIWMNPIRSSGNILITQKDLL